MRRQYIKIEGNVANNKEFIKVSMFLEEQSNQTHNNEFNNIKFLVLINNRKLTKSNELKPITYEFSASKRLQTILI